LNSQHIKRVVTSDVFSGNLRDYLKRNLFLGVITVHIQILLFTLSFQTRRRCKKRCCGGAVERSSLAFLEYCEIER
jgi:hypothetical protein